MTATVLTAMTEANANYLGLCRTAASVRFIAFATSTAGVLAFEWTLSCRMSSLVHGARTGVFFFGMAIAPSSRDRCRYHLKPR